MSLNEGEIARSGSFVFDLLGEEPEAEGKVGILILDFHFSPACCGRELRECGNRNTISKGGGKQGKPTFGFPRFPLPGISAVLLPVTRFSSRVLSG